MSFVCFVGTYRPIMCGIADYTVFLTREMPPGKWGVLSFDPLEFGAPLVPYNGASSGPVRYPFLSRDDISASAVKSGLKQIGIKDSEAVIWFQHEFGIWPDSNQFIQMLKDLDLPRIVTCHTLHFQSRETRSGLRKMENDFLRELLPCVDALTVFSNGVYQAVTTAFPEYRQKVHTLEHGVHSYPAVSALTREQAKLRLHNFLVYESALDEETKKSLEREKVLADMNAVVIGETGFLCPLKQSELLYHVRDKLQRLVPERRVVAVRIGTPREESQARYASELQLGQDGRDKFLLNLWLPQEILALAQRAFDFNFYWPSDCTQSGVLAHGLGVNAIFAGRDLEGTGECLKEAGQIAEQDLSHLVLRMREALLNPRLTQVIEHRSREYARRLSWSNQAGKHLGLARRVLAETKKNGQIQCLGIPANDAGDYLSVAGTATMVYQKGDNDQDTINSSRHPNPKPSMWTGNEIAKPKDWLENFRNPSSLGRG